MRPEFGKVGAPWWDDQPLFVVATGPSLKGFDFDTLRGRGRILAVKQAWRDLPFADACFGLDLPWLTWAGADLARIAGSMELYLAVPDQDGVPVIPGATYLERLRSGERLSDDPGAVDSGGNSGYGALNLAYLKRAKTIVLLGYDFIPDGHYDNASYTPRPLGFNAQYFPGWAAGFAKALPQLRAAGVAVINASPKSRVEAFPKMTLAEALAAIESKSRAA